MPIVAIDFETDPIRAGLAASVSRPGGNVAGLFLDQPSLAGKWLQLLREAVPNIKRVALICDPAGPDQLDAAKAAARAMSLEPFVLELRTSDGFEAAFRTLGNEPKTGIVQLGSPVLAAPPLRLSEASLKHLLPTDHKLESVGLLDWQFGGAGVFVARDLGGALPAHQLERGLATAATLPSRSTPACSLS